MAKDIEGSAALQTGVSDVGLYIGQVAEMLGVTTTMIRQWEKHGFIRTSRTAAGYRVYPMDQIQLMQTVRDLVKSGVNPAGIKLALHKQGDALQTPLAGADHAALGKRLQRLRTAKGVSLRDLGVATQLSASHLSAIERSVTNPSVAVIQRLAAALGTNMIQILGGESLNDKLVVRPDERRPLDEKIQGVEIQQLFRVDTVLESLLFIIEPGASSGESYQHDGEEFLFMLQGSLDITLDETEHFTLEAGDSMTFASHRPHRFSNEGDKSASVLWVNTPPTF